MFKLIGGEYLGNDIYTAQHLINHEEDFSIDVRDIVNNMKHLAALTTEANELRAKIYKIETATTLKATDIFDNMIATKKNFLKVDKWLSKKDLEVFNALQKETKSNIEHDGYTFVLKTKQEGGAGMDSYPASITVYILHKWSSE